MSDCKMMYNNDPCDREPEHLVTVSCTNPLCRINSRPEQNTMALCTPCLQIVMQRERSQCHECGTGMNLTSAPTPISGVWKPHGVPDTTLQGLPLPDTQQL